MPIARRAAITGAPGGGKSTLLEELATRGVAIAPEVARNILKAPGGMDLRAHDSLGFAEAMLDAQLRLWSASDPERVTLYDRGFPDIAGFLRVEGLAVPAEIDRVCREMRYDGPIFRARAWSAIYRPDEQRIQTWKEAVASDEAMSCAWRDYGYELIELPATNVEDRARFALMHL